MENIHKYTLIVNSDCIDNNNHVNNVSYIQWMQDSAISHATKLGFDFKQRLEEGTTWVARSHQIEYLRPAFLDEKIEIYTWISGIEKSKFIREYKFTRDSDKKVLAKAKTEWIYFDVKANRAFRKVPQDIVDMFPISLGK